MVTSYFSCRFLSSSPAQGHTVNCAEQCLLLELMKIWHSLSFHKIFDLALHLIPYNTYLIAKKILHLESISIVFKYKLQLHLEVTLIISIVLNCKLQFPLWIYVIYQWLSCLSFGCESDNHWHLITVGYCMTLTPFWKQVKVIHMTTDTAQWCFLEIFTRVIVNIKGAENVRNTLIIRRGNSENDLIYVGWII